MSKPTLRTACQASQLRQYEQAHQYEHCELSCPVHAPGTCARCELCQDGLSGSCGCCQAEPDGLPELRSPFGDIGRTRSLELGLPPPTLLPGAPPAPLFPAGPPPFSASSSGCQAGDDLSSLLGLTSSLSSLSLLPLPALPTPFGCKPPCAPLPAPLAFATRSLSSGALSPSTSATATSALLTSCTSSASSTPARYAPRSNDPFANPTSLTAPWLRILRPLGSGGCGTVHACDYRGQLAAVKAFPDTPEAADAAARELHFLALANTPPHPCVTALLATPSPLHIVQELIPNNTLSAFLHALDPSSPRRASLTRFALARILPPAHPLLRPATAHAPIAQAWLLQSPSCAAEYLARLSLLLSLAGGLHHIHVELQVPLLHRDVKPDNILLSSSAECVLADFGQALAAPLAPGAPQHPMAVASHTLYPAVDRPQTTIQYAAPEDMGGSRQLGTPADMYSFGVVAWEALTGTRPWSGWGAMAVRYYVTEEGERLPMAGGWPLAMHQLVGRCFESDPALRPSAQEAMLEIGKEIQRVAHLYS